jgi:hypothetical protein
MVPLIKGGSDDKSNLLLAHARCNKEKHNKTLPEHWEWRVRHGLDPENLGHKHGLLELFFTEPCTGQTTAVGRETDDAESPGA